MSTDTSTDAPADEAEEAAPRDELREGILARLTDALGDAVVGHHIRPGDDLWVRVTREAWQETGRIARDRLGCRYFNFLSAIDWLPSPYGRSLDAAVDKLVGADTSPAEGEGDEAGGDVTVEAGTGGIVTGYAGGDTRFQLFARVTNVKEHWGVTFKCDLPDDDLRADTWIPNYHGANWHERETWEMFGITFEGHPNLINLYLPTGFVGHPLRKSFPLLSREVKPWPGDVDVEGMPGDSGAADEPSTENPEA